MKIRIVLLVLAIVFGIAAVFGVMIYLNNVKASVEKEGELVSVLIAAEIIPKDTPVEDMIEKELAKVEKLPKKYIVEGVINSFDKYSGYVASTQINKGEQITPSKLIKLEDIKISFTVPEGLMAVSVPYDEVRGVAYSIKPGDKVNVLATFEPSSQDLVIFTKEMLMAMLVEGSNEQQTAQDDTTGLPAQGFSFVPLDETSDKVDKILDGKEYIVYPQTKIILWNIEVLSIRSQVEANAAINESKEEAGSSGTNAEDIKENAVVLAVTAEQAEKLVFAEELGKAWFALVPASGMDEEETPGRTYLNIIEGAQ